MKLPDDFHHDQAWGTLIRLDHNVRDFTVQRIPHSHQIGENLPGIGRLQQRTVAVPGGAVELLLNRGTEVNHPPASTQHLAVIRPEYRAAASCQHDALYLTQLLDGGMLPLPEALLALYIEYQRDACTGALFDLLVGIPKREAKLLGEQAPDGAFASPHRAHEDDVFNQISDSLR